ncbi:TPA: hypothetical protein ACRNCN_002790 [Pseudomonas aeruginosa]
MKFSGLLRPIYDETFPSWVTRCALNPRIFPVSENDIHYWSACDFRKNFISSDILGMEFDFCDSQGIEVASKLGLSLPLVREVFKPSSALILSREYRSAYCHLCIQSDVKSKRYPSWRKSWCYVDYPYCLEHGCLLCFVDGCDLTNKQWVAFSRGDLGDYMPGRRRGYSRRPGLIPNASRAWLTIRVQAWIENIRRAEQVTLPGTKLSTDSKTLLVVVNLVLRMLLVPRTDRTPVGIGKSIFSNMQPVIIHKVLDFKQRLEFGAANSVPYERMSALLLLGLIFRVFTDKERSCLEDLICESGLAGTPDLKWLGECCSNHISIAEQDLLQEVFSFPDEIMIFLGEFIEGLFKTGNNSAR